jgi:hypothetical protein
MYNFSFYLLCMHMQRDDNGMLIDFLDCKSSYSVPHAAHQRVVCFIL